MASHRAQLLSTLLANALAFGYAEIDPEREPLKVNPLIMYCACCSIDIVVGVESGYGYPN